MLHFIRTLLFVGFFFVLGVATAESYTAAVMSPGCDKETVTALAKGALVSISDVQKWGTTEGFIITLDTDKLSNKDFLRRMQDKDCFKSSRD